MFVPIALALAAFFLAWAYCATIPPPPKPCGSPNGPPATSPRVKLSDGRHLAYREAGVPRRKSKYKIIVIHGFNSSKDMKIAVSQVLHSLNVTTCFVLMNGSCRTKYYATLWFQELIEELGIYFLFFDRAGYGESDPNPSRSVKSEALDIQELVDILHIGSKFYIIGVSLGGYATWSCIKYIPHRLSGVSLVVPFVNYWWPRFPANIQRKAFEKLPVQDRWTFRNAHYAPWLFNWWMCQKMFPTSSIMAGSINLLSPRDLEVTKKMSKTPSTGQEKICQHGVHKSLYRDILVGFGKWEFDPLELENPFRDNEGSVHIWQGYEDRVIPFEINRYISEKHPWIRYHELDGIGHFMMLESNICEAILRALLC